MNGKYEKSSTFIESYVKKRLIRVVFKFETRKRIWMIFLSVTLMGLQSIQR